jgi:hypothetical protein
MIREFLPLLEIDEIDELMPSTRENRDIDSLLEELTELDSVTLELQRDDISLAEVRGLFDGVSEKYPLCSEKLDVNSDIVLDKHFENGVVKIQQGKIDFLTSAEKRHTEHLKISKSKDTFENVGSPTNSFAKRVLKKQKLISQGSLPYMNLEFLVPTSNICERLFSKAGFGFHDRRMAILPMNAEIQIFLHLNMDLWNIDTVKDILSQ